MEKLPFWWPKHPPIYDIKKTYVENFHGGPFFEAAIPERQLPPPSSWKTLFGLPVAVPIGVPAGPLLNANWVAFAAKMGFDVLTYKTIRSQEHPAHPLPNMVYVNTQGMLDKKREGGSIVSTSQPDPSMERLAATNSFGMPSQGPDFVIADIQRARLSLNPGQVLIVSVVGTDRPGEDYAQDFVAAASLARDGGAHILEANFSCPNVGGKSGSIYLDPESVFALAQKIKQTIPELPLVIKVGVFPNRTLCKEVLLAAARAGVDGICGINTVGMEVKNADGSFALGEERKRAGICGGPIRQAALEFLREAASIIREEKLGLTLMGTGGITLPDHFDAFFEEGAQVAMSAVGMMWDPYLAARYHQNNEVN